MLAYCNDNPVLFVDYDGGACIDALRRGGDGLIIGGAGSGGGGDVTLLLLDIFIYTWENITNSKTKSSTRSSKSSATAGGVLSPKPPKKGNESPKFDAGTVYNKDGVRIDYEYNGNGSGNVHLHKNGNKYYYDSINSVLRTTASISSTLAPPAIQKLLYDPQIQKALTRGIEIIQSLGGK